MLSSNDLGGDDMRRVLIVEDDSVMLNRLVSLLKEVEDLEIDQAPDEATARACMANRKYQIALVDIELGPSVKDRYVGMAITSELSNQGCIPLIVSGTGDDTLKGVAATLWGYDFVSKPFNDQDLLNKVVHALDWAEIKRANLGPQTWPDGLKEAPDDPTKMFWKDKPLGLTVTELTLTRRLAKSPGVMVPYPTLQKLLKSGNSPAALASHFTNIRKKFRETDTTFSHLVNAGQGYIWK